MTDDEGASSAPPPGDEDYLERLRGAANGANGTARVVAPPPEWPTAAEYLQRMGPVGPRLSTGIEALDRYTRGGIPRGKRTVLVGAPGACKTMLATLWASQWEAAGAAVVYLAADDAPEQIAMRLGQLAGYTREDLEADADDARQAAAGRLAGSRIVLLDGEDASLEDAVAALTATSRGHQPVLIIDSLQTVRCLEASGADSIRERITTTIRALRAPARAGAVVVAISEMSRGGYRGDRTQETSALAAAKESGAIEYAGDLLLGLRTVRDEIGQVEIEVAKNRLGHTPPADERIRLRLDFASARLNEMTAPDPDTAPTSTRRGRDRLARAKAAVKRAVMEHELRSATAVYMVTRGTKDDILTAVREMLGAGELVKLETGVLRLASGVVDET